MKKYLMLALMLAAGFFGGLALAQAPAKNSNLDYMEQLQKINTKLDLILARLDRIEETQKKLVKQVRIMRRQN